MCVCVGGCIVICRQNKCKGLHYVLILVRVTLALHNAHQGHMLCTSKKGSTEGGGWFKNRVKCTWLLKCFTMERFWV